MRADYKECIFCPEGCRTCTNSSYCYNCTIGYTLNSTFLCVKNKPKPKPVSECLLP